MTSNVLPLLFAPSQASSRQNSNLDSYLQYCEVDSLKPSKSKSSLQISAARRIRERAIVSSIKPKIDDHFFADLLVLYKFQT